MFCSGLSIFCRVLTGPKKWGTIKTKFIHGEPNSLWRKMYKNHMSDESFKTAETTTQSIIATNELQTAYFPIEGMAYYSKPCELKYVWVSPETTLFSYAFPKASPLLPFFKYAYNNIRQSGGLQRVKEKWRKNAKSLNCDSGNSMEPITLNRIGSLIALVIIGVLFAIVALFIEVFKDKISTTKNCTQSTTLESEIDVQQGINVGPGNFDRNNKRMTLIKPP